MRSLLILAFATIPLATSAFDTNVYCGQYDEIKPNDHYTLCLDLWGKVSTSPGSQCAKVNSLNGSNISWETTWTWAGGSGIKSYTNVGLATGLNKALSSITRITSSWTWSQSSSSGIVADVAYDLFTTNQVGGADQFEIMIWLASYNAGPISYTYRADGQAEPVHRGVQMAGHNWNVYLGCSRGIPVFSFLPISGKITSFHADLKNFLTYLINNQGLPSSQILKTAEAGTEATSGGPVTFRTSSFSMSVH